MNVFTLKHPALTVLEKDTGSDVTASAERPEQKSAVADKDQRTAHRHTN